MSRAISNSRIRQVSELTYQMVLSAKISHAPVDVELIAKSCGVTIENTDLGDEVSGLLVIHGNKAVIAHNPNQSRQRKRFTIAHELGHFALHRDEGTDTVFVDKDFIIKYRGNRIYSEVELRQEQEANAFAASLLMPKEFIFDEMSKDDFRYLQEGELIEKLAKTFDVSVAAMTFRLTNLNILY